MVYPNDDDSIIIKIKGEEYKKLLSYQEKTQVPFWKIIKDIIEGKIKVEEEKNEPTENRPSM